MKRRRYELFSMLVEAARAGLGIALAPTFLVQNELASGVLVVPYSLSLRSERRYYLVYPESKQNSTLRKTFEGWFLNMAKAYSENSQPEAGLVRKTAS